MRKINGKLFLGLLLGTLVLTGSVFGVHQFQYRRIADALLWQARHAEEQGQPERLALYLQRYLEFNPRDDAAKERLARAWAGEAFDGQPRVRARAVRLLDEVLNHDGDRPELRRLLVKLALELYNAKLARGHLEKLLPAAELQRPLHEDDKPDPPRGELEGYWAQLLDLEKKPAEAIDCCRRAVRHAPDGQDSYVRLAYLLRRAKEDDPDKRAQNHAEAGRALDELVKNNGTSHKAFLARWRYRREFELLDLRETAEAGKFTLAEAAEDVAQALKRAPEQVDVLLAAADLARLKGQAALEAPKLGAERREQLLKEQREEAARYLERGLALQEKQGKKRAGADPARFQLLWHKAALLLDELKQLQDKAGGDAAERRRALEAQVAATIEQVRKDRQLPAAADFLQGRLLAYHRRWAEAAALFEQAGALLASQPDLAAQANLYLGQCYEQLEEPNAMFQAYKRVAEWDPNSAAALLGMGTALWSQGRHEEGMAKYKQVIARGEVPARGWFDVARLEMELQGQQARPDWSAAEGYLKKAEEANKDAVEVPLLRAELLLRQGKADEAEALLRRAKEKRPREVELWTGLAELALRRKDPEAARATLDEAEKALGADSALLRLERARLLAGKPGKEVAAALRKLAEGSEKFGEEERGRLLGGLADAQYRAGNLGEARELWQQVARLPKQRTNLRLRLLLFDLALKEGNEAGMEQALEEVRAVERSGGAFASYGRALQLIWRARNHHGEARPQLEEARLLLDRVLAQRPAWPPVFVARAEISEQTGNPERAVGELQDAVKNGETSVSVLRRLAELQDRLGRYQDAEATLKLLRPALKASPGLSRVAAGVALHRQNLTQALELAQAAVREDSKDPRDLLWLGQLLAAAGKPEEAEKKLREAVKQGPKEPGAWLALVRFLAERRRPAEATAVIRDAAAKLPEDRQALTLAQCHEAVGQGKEAVKYYEEALRLHGGDALVVGTVATFYLNTGQVLKAEPLLRKLAFGEVKAAPAQVERARYGLAVVLANGTDYRRFAEALDLVGLRLDAQGQLAAESDRGRESTERKRCKARVLATQPQKQFRARAVELLEELERSGALLPDDRFVLGVLYDADGDWARARAQVRDLTRLPAPAPRHLAWYAMGQLRQPAPDLAEVEYCVRALGKLEKDFAAGPNAFASVELQARLWEAQGKGEQALQLLRKHVGREGARPEEGLLVQASLRRQKRYAEAFAECERIWAEGKWAPEVAGSVSISLLRVIQPTDAQCLKVENWLKRAIAAKPKSVVVLQMHLADLYDQRGRYPEAEQMYREVLKAEPGNFVALNNLAWLLALRQGDAAEAERYVNLAISKLGRRGDLLDTRGLVRIALGQPEAAVADLRDANADSETATRLFHLARAHHLARDRDSAYKALTQARKRGLQPGILHPVEQEACRKLLAELNVP